MIFVTNVRPDLPLFSPRLGHTIRFEEGRYETDDPAEIDVLRRNPHVSGLEPAPGPDVKALKDTLAGMPREKLDEAAGQAGVERPEKLPRKSAVVEAIEERQGDDRPAAQ
jgi:hypothetical protein